MVRNANESGSIKQTMKLVTARDIHAALIRQGSSCRQWALANGYSPRTVQKCITEHPPSSKKKVRGATYRTILRELSETLGQDLLRNKDNE
ncbi:hypothetical protein VCSRO12_0206 [Vibrio cholerae]|nr:hypothetical protein [Vibrio cholerae]GHY58494.1 hypothetical protein VCSRO12_0206 [Vibrio cholerae]